MEGLWNEHSKTPLFSSSRESVENCASTATVVSAGSSRSASSCKFGIVPLASVRLRSRGSCDSSSDATAAIAASSTRSDSSSGRSSCHPSSSPTPHRDRSHTIQ